jgi:predicted RND superfamily exporter protein
LVVLGAQRAGHTFDFMTRTRPPLLGFLATGVLAGLIGMVGMSLDMSFRPLFTSNHAELDKTRQLESTFGKAGSNQLVAIVDVDDAHNPDALMAVADLANDLGSLTDVVKRPKSGHGQLL